MKSRITPVSLEFEPVKVEIYLERPRDLFVLWHRLHSLPRMFNINVPKVETTQGLQDLSDKLSDLVRKRGLWGNT